MTICYINKLRDEFSAQEQALQDSWTVEDRKADMSETQAQLDIYANAVTDRGQQKYKELQEQMKQLQRDEELYQLQVKNNATNWRRSMTRWKTARLISSSPLQQTLTV